MIFAAHIHLLQTPLADTLLRDVLQESYPTLVQHATRVVQLAFPDSSSYPKAPASKSGFSLRSLFPRFPQPPSANDALRNTPAWKTRDRQFKLMRWGFFGTAALTFASYLYFAGIIPLYLESFKKVQAMLEADSRLQVIDDDDEEDDDEDDELESEI